jgi:hypothetical protein
MKDKKPHKAIVIWRRIMKIIKNEEHRLTRSFTYDIPDETIEEAFGSIQRFKEIVSHNTNDWNKEPEGEEPTDQEYDAFYDFFADHDCEIEDDIWTDRKGSYETSYELGDQ